MADKTPLPEPDQFRKLLEELLPPDEEMDEVSSAAILEGMGVDTGSLPGDLRARLEREVQELQARGEAVPRTLLDALSSLRPEGGQEDDAALDPEAWIDSLIAGRMPGHLTPPDSARHLQAFRSRNEEFLTEEDLRILEELAAELRSEIGGEEE
jgi:hypothetical protein